jgi:hypothetical protein
MSANLPKQKSPPPSIPEIEKCPRCGHDILLGDRRCSNCGYNVQSIGDSIRELSPRFVALIGFVIALFAGLVAISTEDVVQGIFAVIAFGAVLGGGLYWVLYLVFVDPKRPRRPLR